MNQRRRVLLVAGASALAAPFGSFAQQQGKVWRLGFLSPRSRPGSMESDYQFGAMLRDLRELGYVEGKNLFIEWRFADGKYERFAGMAAELVQLKVDVIVTGGPTATSAAQKATTTIPIIMGGSGDPVSEGFVKSLSRPGGNITGLSSITAETSPKQLEMLLSIVPKLSRVAVLVNPTNVSHAMVLTSIQAAAQTARVTILRVEARTAPEIEQAFSVMAREKIGAFIAAAGDALVRENARQIADLAIKHRLPSVAAFRGYPEVGGLMSYGPSLSDIRRVAAFVDRIFKGAKPGDLPVQQPTLFEMLVNGKTAKTLSLKIPQSLLASADKVIE